MKFRSILLAEARGSIAGATFSRNGNSAYVRARATPVNPRTPDQTRSRDNLNAIATAWRDLTQTERTSWIDLARTVPYVNNLGESSFYSGFQMFMKCNLTVMVFGNGMIRQAPASAPTFPAVELSSLVAEQDSVTFGDFSLNAQYVTKPVDSTQVVVIDATYAMSGGKSFVAKNQYRMITMIPVSQPSGLQPLTNPWNAVYGLPSVSLIGTRINVRARIVSLTTGFASPYVELSTLVQEA